MQNTVLPMAVDITVNVVNVVISYILAVHTPMGVAGVAAGTLWHNIAVFYWLQS